MRSLRNGFTLIELLVVIAIIGILLSVMVPALNSAKEQCKKMICMNHMKQSGIAFNLYSSENDGYCVIYHNPQREPRPDTCIQWWSVFIWDDYLPDNRVIYCPSYKGPRRDKNLIDRDRLIKEYQGPYGNPWLGNIGNILWMGPVNETMKGLSYPVGPGDNIVLLDAAHPPENVYYTFNEWVKAGATKYRDPANCNEVSNALFNGDRGYAWGLSVRHNWRTNVIYFDGHAASCDGEELWNIDWKQKGGNPLDGF
jgi:prepilin-type N-terminal cleavage/methylation domain-containing protein/prepilin-type processing-associated H-X9-DG protein